MQWLIGEVDVRISGLKRVCTKKTMRRTSEVPREEEVKGVNENPLLRVILPHTAVLKWKGRSSWRCLNLVAFQNIQTARSVKDLGVRVRSREKKYQKSEALMQIRRAQVGPKTAPRGDALQLLQCYVEETRVALPHGVSPSAVSRLRWPQWRMHQDSQE